MQAAKSAQQLAARTNLIFDNFAMQICDQSSQFRTPLLLVYRQLATEVKSNDIWYVKQSQAQAKSSIFEHKKRSL